LFCLAPKLLTEEDTVGNYILIGIPDSGKSTLGQKAAEILGMDFYDIDVLAKTKASAKRLLVPMSMISTALIIEEEKNVLEELARTAKRSIIATGAETSLDLYNLAILKSFGVIICISRDPDAIIADIRANKRHSLILEDMQTHKTIKVRELAVKQSLKYRSAYEVNADIVLDNNGGEDAGLEKLVAIIEKCESQKDSPDLGYMS
jgi:shikimate kinase